MNNIIKIGNQDKVITKIKIAKDLGTKSISITYEDDFDSAIENAPEIGSFTSFCDDLPLKKIDVDSDDGSIGIVNLTYEKFPDASREDESEEPEDPDDPDDPEGGGGGGGGGGSGQVRKNISYQLNAAVSDEPILTNKAYAKLEAEKLGYLKALLDGTRPSDLINDSKKGKIVLSSKKDEDGVPIPKKVTLQSKLDTIDSKLVEKINQGITSYKSPGAVWVKKYISNQCPSLSGIGKISRPSGAPDSGDRNWILSCREASSSRNAKGIIQWECSETWELSGPKGWDKDLYK